MRREMVLGGLLVLIIGATLLFALVAPGVFAQPTDTRPDGRVSLSELSISAGTVTGDTVELTTDARLENRDGVSDNVTLEFRAVGLNSGLVGARKRVTVGEITDTREVRTAANLTVERGTDYRLETVVYQNGQRRDIGSKTVRGTGSLTPGYADHSVGFHQFTSPELPVIEYAIRQVGDNQTELAVWTHLTNAGSQTSDSMRVVLKARQVDSNIVADQTSVAIGSIGPGKTEVPNATLSVPSSYNYYLDAVLYNDGVIIETARSGASLDPTETVDVNTTTRDIGLEVSDFESATDEQPTGPDDDRDRETEAGESGPGFGVGITLVAIVTGLLVYGRTRTEEHDD